MRAPTAKECSAHATLEDVDEYGKARILTACWYPQMGGYGGKCLIYANGSGCFDVYVWHDGEFPFTEVGRAPTHLHHCDAQQFIDFGKFAQELDG